MQARKDKEKRGEGKKGEGLKVKERGGEGKMKRLEKGRKEMRGKGIKRD